MVLNFSLLIKISGTETHPAAKTQSIGLPAYAQLAWVFAEPSAGFTLTPNLAPSIGICPSTVIIPSASFTVTQNSQSSSGIIPSGSFNVTQNSQPSTGIIPSRQLCLDTETFSHLPGLYLDQKDRVHLPGLCKNSCQRVPLAATH